MKYISYYKIIIIGVIFIFTYFYAALVNAQPLRVISLTPTTTELAYEVGLGPNLIAVSDYSDYPTEANKLEKVASGYGVKFERILLLKPDLVLASRGTNPERELKKFAQYGIQVFYSDPQRLEDIADDMEKLAVYSNDPDGALDKVTAYRERLKQLAYKYDTARKLSAVLLFGFEPLFASSNETLQSDVLRRCGATNVFADSPTPWPQISREQLMSRKPDVLVIGTHDENSNRIIDQWQQKLNIPMLRINPDWLNRDGPRILLSVESLCKQLELIRQKK